MKITKATAHYLERSNGRRHCLECTMFVKPGSCTLVLGDISRRGVCKYFHAKEAAEQPHSPGFPVASARGFASAHGRR